MTTQDFNRLYILEKSEASDLISWCRDRQLTQETYNGKPTKRFEGWWGVGVRLFNNGHEFFEADRVDPVIQNLSAKFYPTANSFLLYRYEPGAGISEHCDRNCWQRRVVLVNLIDASPDLFGDKPCIKFKHGGRVLLLSDGEVIEFDSGISHSVPPVKEIRYSLQLRETR